MQAVADSARRLAAKERFISHSLQVSSCLMLGQRVFCELKVLRERYHYRMLMQAAEQLPHQLVQLDLHLSVVHHHLSNLADSARRVATADDSVT